MANRNEIFHKTSDIFTIKTAFFAVIQLEGYFLISRKDWEFAFSPDSMEKLIDDGIDAQFLNPANLQEQVRSIQQSLNSQNQVCSESFENILKINLEVNKTNNLRI